MECEKLAGRSMTTTRKLISDAFFVVPFMRDESRIQSEITVETFMTAKRPISVGEPVTADVANAELPDLSPLNFTISLPQENIYKIRDIYRNAGECNCRNTAQHFVNSRFRVSFYSHSQWKFVHVPAHNIRSLFAIEIVKFIRIAGY